MNVTQPYSFLYAWAMTAFFTAVAELESCDRLCSPQILRYFLRLDRKSLPN